jgi:hypothetical protein
MLFVCWFVFWFVCWFVCWLVCLFVFYFGIYLSDAEVYLQHKVLSAASVKKDCVIERTSSVTNNGAKVESFVYV